MMLRVKHVVEDETNGTGKGAGGGQSNGTPPAGETPPAGNTPPAGETPPAGSTPPAGETPPAGSGEQPPIPAGEAEHAKRYSELTARTKAAEKSAADAAERERLALEALQRLGRPAPAQDAGVQEPVEPTAPDWNGDPVVYQQEMAKYAKDLSTYAAGKAARAAVAEDAARRANETKAETTKRLQAEWNVRRQAAITRFPDYEVVAENPNLKITDVMAGAITMDPEGANVGYWLGQNPAEAERIAALPPAQQLVEFGAAKSKAAAWLQSRTVTRTPSPVNRPQGSGSSQPVNPADLPMDDYANRRNEQLAKERRPGNR